MLLNEFFSFVIKGLIIFEILHLKCNYVLYFCLLSDFKHHLLPDVEKMKLLADGGIVVCGKEGEIYRVAKYNTHGTLLSSLALQEKPWDMVEIKAGTQRCLAFSH